MVNFMWQERYLKVVQKDGTKHVPPGRLRYAETLQEQTPIRLPPHQGQESNLAINRTWRQVSLGGGPI